MTVDIHEQTDRPQADAYPEDAELFEPPHSLRQRLVTGLIGLMVLGAIAGGGYLAYRKVAIAPRQAAVEQLKTVAVERTTVPITVSANGSVEPDQSTNVSPKTSGRLARIVVQEGDYVQEGQILAYMDASDLQGQLLEAQGQLEAAQANLAMLKAGNRPQEIAQSQASLNSAEASYRQANEDYRRYSQLYTDGAISAQDLDTYRTALDTAQAEVNSAQQALSLSRAGSRPEEIAQAEAQVLQAKGALKSIQTQIDDAVIRAPFSGIVTTRYADPGDFVAPTTSASENSSATSSSILSLASTYQIVADVAETDIAKIKPGQPVTFTADAFPDQTFSGTVAQVAEQATVTANVTSFEVRADVNDPQHLLKPGMNGSVDFKAGELKDVLVVPTVAIARQSGGEGVMVLNAAGKPQFQPITSGITVGNQTVVKSGLTGNEQVIVNAAPPASSGSGSQRRGLLPSGPPPGGQP